MERGILVEKPRGQSSPSKAVTTLEQPTGMVGKDWVQFTITDSPLLQLPALVVQLLLEGFTGSLGLPISASTLPKDLSVHLKATLKLMRAPQDMVSESMRLMEQSEALPFLEDWYWVQAMLTDEAATMRKRQRVSLPHIHKQIYYKQAYPSWLYPVLAVLVMANQDSQQVDIQMSSQRQKVISSYSSISKNDILRVFWKAKNKLLLTINQIQTKIGQKNPKFLTVC